MKIKGLEIRPGECHKLSGELVVCLTCGLPEYFWKSHIEQIASGPFKAGYIYQPKDKAKKQDEGFVCPDCQPKGVAA